MRATVLIMAMLIPSYAMAGRPTVSLIAGADSCLVIPAPPGIGSFSVVLTSEAISGCSSLSIAMFRIAGLPEGWLAITTPNPGAVTRVTGNLFGDGATVDFNPSPELPPTVLFDVTLWPPLPGASATLRVESVLPPIDPDYPCPRVWGDCVYSPVCADGGTLDVNGGRCTVGVDPASWSQAKRLYQ